MGNFIIYVIGKNDGLIAELKTLASKKKVGNQDIEIKNTHHFDAAITANIIYLLPDASKLVSEASSKSKSNSTLVVAESPNACKTGSCINFVIIDNKLKFEYSKNNAVKSGLKTNDDFKVLAINVDN